MNVIRALFRYVCLGLLVAGAAARAENPQGMDTKFTMPDDIEITLCVQEPVITQPVYLTFDERGRMWVVQYRQYPFPNGLKVTGHDMYWRVTYDNWPPPPPPLGAKGQDRVTILEDTDGDGQFESAKDFLSDLNIATAALPGKGGVWVLNPPYLLFYPDANADDVPDGDPEVHLAGFGLEDMHAVANSLMWGPDGWIYACQGSTCKASITQPGIDKPAVDFSGQAIWRYEPTKKIFEIFAEGGYNNFGIAMDPAGRMFTGTNGGLIGVYYMQGGYYWKNWGKHGPHTNPYTFGYLPSMPDESSRAKLSQGMAWHERGGLPERYNNQLIVARVMQYRVDACQVTPDGSNFSAKELGPILSTEDTRFRPVDVKVGPDGALYIADWFDGNVTWQVSAEKYTTDRDTGRIYRLASKGTPHYKPFDMTKESRDNLLGLLLDGNSWQNQMALRVLREREDLVAADMCMTAMMQTEDTRALRGMWGLYAGARASEPTPKTSSPDLQRWAVRLAGDDGDVKEKTRAYLLELADHPDTAPEVIAQIAATARRLPAGTALPLLQRLILRADSAEDPFTPQMVWWAVEENLAREPVTTQAWLLGDVSWETTTFARTVLPRLGQRAVLERSPESLAFAAALIARASEPAQLNALLGGMEEGLRGARLDAPPDALKQAIAALLVDSVPDGKLINVAMRLGVGDTASLAMEALKSGRLVAEDRRAVLQMLAEQRQPDALAMLVALLNDGPSSEDRAAAVEGLQHYGGAEAAEALVAGLPKLDTATTDKALGVLVSRKEGALKLLQAVDASTVPAKRLALDVLTTARSLNDDAVNELLTKHYGNVRKSPEELQRRLKEVRDALDTAAGAGDKARGKLVYAENCAKCHVFFGEGRQVGPELTGVERSNRELLLQSIIDPSATVLPEFMASTFTLRDGDPSDPFSAERQVTGFLLEETPQSVTLIDSAGNEITVPPAAITQREAMELSLMPTGLLDATTPQQIRDLFVYLQSAGP